MAKPAFQISFYVSVTLNISFCSVACQRLHQLFLYSTSDKDSQVKMQNESMLEPSKLVVKCFHHCLILARKKPISAFFNVMEHITSLTVESESEPL